MKARLVRSRREADNISTFWFEPEKPINYISGQFIEMTLAHKNPDKRGIKRWFTLSSSPNEAPLISITTKHALKSSSFKTTLFSLKRGDTVIVSEAMGDFVLPHDANRSLTFIAGGIGITPFHSIIAWLLETKQQRDITFIYSISNEGEMIFQDLFDHYGMKRTIIVNRPQKAWSGITGQLNGKRILKLTDIKPDSLIYLSGPEAMVESLIKELEELNVPEDQLVGDYFPGYQAI